MLKLSKLFQAFPKPGFVRIIKLCVAHLAQHGYLQTSASSLFRHVSANILFCLVVDDFGVKYEDIGDFHSS